MDEVLRIWGEHVRFLDFTATELAEVDDSFAGSVRPASGEAIPPALTIRAIRASFPRPPEGRITVRHRGGSSAKKIYLDRTPFDGDSQARDVQVLAEGNGLALYYADGALVAAAPREITVMAVDLPPLLLSDLIENWLISRARGRGEVQLHCSGWSRSDSVELVLGDSGAGKTTALFAALRDGAGFFSNDRAFVRLRGDTVEARTFPLPVNVGCGTIRALGVDLPHFDLPDDYKIRLTPSQVVERYPIDFDRWWPIRSVHAPGNVLGPNVLWDGDPDHPFWNHVFRAGPLYQRNRLEATLSRLVSSATVTAA